MSSILKILVDVGCQIYCDYEFKGDAVPGTIFRIEMRKGNYILEFKQDGKLLLSQEYDMESNDEEKILRVSLAEIIRDCQIEQKFKGIEALNVKTTYNHDIERWMIVNEETGESTIINYNV